jgi:hypothetical protein
LDGFFQCGKFDETQLMPMLVCQSLDSLQLTPLCQPNLNIHANHPLKTQIFFRQRNFATMEWEGEPKRQRLAIGE